MDGTAPKEFVIYVRSQPLEAHADLPVYTRSPVRRLFGSALTGGFFPGSDPAPPENATHPGVGLPRGEAQCLRLVLDLARRTETIVRVVDVSNELVPRDIVETASGEPRFFPILVRPDGMQLAGEEDFIPGRVRKFLKGR